MQTLFIPFVQLNDVEGSLLVYLRVTAFALSCQIATINFCSKQHVGCLNNGSQVLTSFTVYVDVQLSRGCALLEPGDLWDTISSAFE